MKKSFYLVLFALLLMFSTAANFASAKGSSKDLTLAEKAQNLSQSNLSKETKKEKFQQAIDGASKEEKEVYLEKVEKTIKENLSHINVEEGVNIKKDLGSGISLEFRSEDQSESSDQSVSKSLISEPQYVTNGYDYSNGNLLWKDYGDRRFTCTVSVKSAGITIGALVLANHYRIGSYGLVMRYASTAGTNGTSGLMSIKSSSSSVPDPKAEKVGYNMNARGLYSWTLGIGGLYKSFTSEIYSTIRLDKLYSTEALVYQNYSYTE